MYHTQRFHEVVFRDDFEEILADFNRDCLVRFLFAFLVFGRGFDNALRYGIVVDEPICLRIGEKLVEQEFDFAHIRQRVSRNQHFVQHPLNDVRSDLCEFELAYVRVDVELRKHFRGLESAGADVRLLERHKPVVYQCPQIVVDGGEETDASSFADSSNGGLSKAECCAMKNEAGTTKQLTKSFDCVVCNMIANFSISYSVAASGGRAGGGAVDFDIVKFNKTYRGTKWFAEESKYFDAFLRDIQDDELMSHIKFCNDVLQLPPVYVYVKSKSDIFERELERKEKLALGACFGYLFQYGEYADEYGEGSARSVWVGDKITGIKTASYFVGRGK